MSANTGNLLKDSVIEATRKYMAGKPNMDKLNLKNVDAIKKLIQKEGDGQSEEIVCSSKVVKINRKGLNQDRYLLITNKAIYNLKPKKYKQSQRRVLIAKVGMVTLSSMSPEFAIHVTDEYDYHFSSKHKDDICEVLQDLFEMENEGQELLVVYSPLKHLKDIILTKKLAKFEHKDKKNEMKRAIKAKSMKNVMGNIDDNNEQKQEQKPQQYKQPQYNAQQQQQQQNGYNNQQQQQQQPQQYNNNNQSQQQYNNQNQPQQQYYNNNNNQQQQFQQAQYNQYQQPGASGQPGQPGQQQYMQQQQQQQQQQFQGQHNNYGQQQQPNQYGQYNQNYQNNQNNQNNQNYQNNQY